MKARVLLFLVLLLFSTTAARADVDVSVRVGVPLPAVVIVEPPVFVFSPVLGFYVAVGIPHDVVFIGSYYYIYVDNVWHRARYYNGPWVVVRSMNLPPGLRKHKFEEIRTVRAEQNKIYQADKEHFKGKQFRPKKHEVKERAKKETKPAKEERKPGIKKEERKPGIMKEEHGPGMMKEERKPKGKKEEGGPGGPGKGK